MESERKMANQTEHTYREWAKQHPNFMTPHIVGIRIRGNHIIETSTGTDFDNKQIWGVTLIQIIKGEYYQTYNTLEKLGLNKMCRTKEEVKEAINRIERYLKGD